MKKYTLMDNLISGLIGVVLSIPLCIGAYNSHTNSVPIPVEIDYEYSEDPTYYAEPIILESTTEIVTEKKALGRFKVTAYCACEKCCPGTSDGLTYTETVATEGRTIAVDPNVIPLGSRLEVNGVEYIAEDIGGAIKGNKVDIFFNSHDVALEWGVQEHDVYLLN